MIRTIKAVSIKKKAEGKIGFLTEEEEGRWFNVKAEESALDELLKNVIQKGNTVEFEMEKGIPKNFSLKKKGNTEVSEDLTSFEDLLADAHSKFEQGFSVRTDMIQVDWEKKNALFKATVEVIDGEGDLIYQAYGDATQENCGEMVKKHWIRMAETRAIARALRWATNNAKAAEEETEEGEIPEEIDESEMAKP